MLTQNALLEWYYPKWLNTFIELNEKVIWPSGRLLSSATIDTRNVQTSKYIVGKIKETGQLGVGL